MQIQKQNKTLRDKVIKLTAENKDLRENLARLKAEKSDLERSLKKEKDIFQFYPAGTILIQDGRITDINQTMLDHLKLIEDEVVGKEYMEFVHPDYVASEKKILSKWAQERRITEEHETCLVDGNGETIYCEIRTKKVRIRGRNLLLLSLVRLERRRAQEKEVVLREKKLALDRLISGLVKVLDPYFGISADNLTNDTGPDGNLLKDSSINPVENSMYHIRSYMGKLKVLSDHEHDTANWTVFDISETVSHVIERMRAEWMDSQEGTARRIALKSYLRANAKVRGNHEEIKIAISNIIRNAADSMEGIGEIHITTEESGGYSHIYILDSGKGVPARFRDVIFDPCFTTKEGNSQGLGLSLCNAIIKKHGGEIEFISRKNQGSIFDVRLPVAKDEIPKISNSFRRAINNLNILIIQGDEIVRELLSHAFKSNGHSADIADNGLEGLGKIKKKRFDLVIADCSALDVVRDSFAKKVKQIVPEMLLIYIKENNEDPEKAILGDFNADLVVRKPIDTAGLLEAALDLIAMNIKEK